MSNSPPQKTNPKVKNNPLNTTNRFSVLDNESENNANSSTSDTLVPDVTMSGDTDPTLLTVKRITPPPIFIQSVSNYKGMIDRIMQTIPNQQFATKAIANNGVKISVNEVDSYRKLVKEFRLREIKFYTYQIKSERAFKVVIRNLHHSINTDEIKEALQDEGFSVRNVVNIRHRLTKAPLPMFFIDLEPVGDYKKIYDLKILLHHRIIVESPRPRKDVAQCLRCQQYGHTKAYCTLSPVCVKCGEEHESKECKKPFETKPTCGLCGGDHTANYRGCPTYLRLKNSSMTNQVKPAKSTNLSLRATSRSYESTQNPTSYAKVLTSQDSRNEKVSPTENSTNKLEQMFEKMCGQFETMTNQNIQILNLLTKLITKLI